jgi:predicted dehydrogenase
MESMSAENDSIRVGLVGPGWWAETMFVPAVEAHTDADLVAVCGRDLGRTRAFADAHGIDHVFSDAQEMFDSGVIDAVIISTINRVHHPLTMAALDAGLHVLCEKPLATTIEEADEMAATARETGLTCHVPFTYRYMPVTHYVKRLLEEGYVGRPYLLNLRYYTGYARDGRYAWRFDPAEAGNAGVLGDLGSHWVDLAQWYFGEIEAVTCVTSHTVEREPRPDGGKYDPLDDGATIIVEFESGAQGVLTVTAAVYEDSPFGQTHQIDVFGSEGTLYALNDWNTVQQVRGAKVGDHVADLPIPDGVWGDARRDFVHDTYRDIYRNQDVLTRGWLSAIRDGEKYSPDFDTGAAVQRVISACETSAAEQRRVHLAEVC